MHTNQVLVSYGRLVHSFVATLTSELRFQGKFRVVHLPQRRSSLYLEVFNCLCPCEHVGCVLWVQQLVTRSLPNEMLHSAIRRGLNLFVEGVPAPFSEERLLVCNRFKQVEFRIQKQAVPSY